MTKHPNWARIILALDSSSWLRLEEQLDAMAEWVSWVKIGPIPFLAHGAKLITAAHRRGYKVFLDMKFHDIPNTMWQAARVALEMGVDMINFHALAGEESLKTVVDNLVSEYGRRCPLMIGVTVLTSHAVVPWRPEVSPRDEVQHLAGVCQQAGLDGIVCSALEVTPVKAAYPELLCVTPGIRLVPSHDDQRRWLTPEAAFAAGADYLVMGRSLLGASRSQLEALNARLHQIPPHSRPR